jgi:hypothetical protein
MHTSINSLIVFQKQLPCYFVNDSSVQASSSISCETLSFPYLIHGVHKTNSRSMAVLLREELT